MDTNFPHDLQNRFERAIVAGEYARGQTLPVAGLARQFEAPMEQMRRVVGTAQRKGLVRGSRPGTGLGAGEAGEAVQILGLPTTDFASVFTHTAGSGLKPRSEVREVEIEPATPLVAGKLGVEPGSPVYRYVRTRYVDEEVLANQTNYMPYDVCPGLEHDDVSRYSFQKLLEEKYLAVLVEMQEEYLLVPATQQDRNVLGLPPGASVLVIDRIALSATGWPLVWADIRIRPDRYPYVAALWPEAAELLKTVNSEQ